MTVEVNYGQWGWGILKIKNEKLKIHIEETAEMVGERGGRRHSCAGRSYNSGRNGRELGRETTTDAGRSFQVL
jgi:hypothetical protein